MTSGKPNNLGNTKVFPSTFATAKEQQKCITRQKGSRSMISISRSFNSLWSWFLSTTMAEVIT